MANASLADHKFYVYVHSRLSNGEPFYVGKGTGRRSSNNINRSDHWKRIVAKDGGFYLSYIKKDISDELSMLLECELIAKYRSSGVVLINQTDGGDGLSGFPSKRKGMKGKKLSDEAKNRMSIAQKARTVWPKLTEEHKKKISEFHKGNKWALGTKASEETREKLSNIHKGKQHTLGHKLTPEHKAKLAESHKNRTKEEREVISKKLSESGKLGWIMRKQNAV